MSEKLNDVLWSGSMTWPTAKSAEPTGRALLDLVVMSAGPNRPANVTYADDAWIIEWSGGGLKWWGCSIGERHWGYPVTPHQVRAEVLPNPRSRRCTRCKGDGVKMRCPMCLSSGGKGRCAMCGGRQMLVVNDFPHPCPDCFGTGRLTKAVRVRAAEGDVWHAPAALERVVWLTKEMGIGWEATIHRAKDKGGRELAALVLATVVGPTACVRMPLDVEERDAASTLWLE